ncbi:MAG: hypothetical protein PHC61_15890, partial [Chitinivibrionales bacterium]|nr:hypothetical protein [Chitinivibrionales bacterium]
MKIRNARFLFALFPLIAAFNALGAVSEPLFWEQEIASSFSARTIFYQQLGLGGDSALSTDRNIVESLPARLAGLSDRSSPWFHFVTGVSLILTNTNAAGGEFKTALSQASENPGMLWALFVEFRRLNYDAWATVALNRLQKCFLSSGAQRAPVITQQLLFFAEQEKENGRVERVQEYQNFAQQFDKNLVLPLAQTALSSFPFNPGRWFAALSELLSQIAGSWEMQLGLIQTFWQWLYYFLLVILSAVVGVLSYKYLPLALHTAADRFPRTLRPELRLALTLIMV